MIIDSSAILAILYQETDAGYFAEAIVKATVCRMSAANFLEAAINIDTKGDSEASRQLDTLIRRTDIQIEPVTLEHAQIARQADQDFGKGRHPAGLNFGDCCAYALAKSQAEPLLFKGDDFVKTDITLYQAK